MPPYKYAIRTYLPEDLEGYLSLRTLGGERDSSGSYVYSQVIAEQAGWPDYTPAKDLFILEAADGIAGYAKVVPELAIGRVVLTFWVHPRLTDRGWGKELLAAAVGRAGQLNAIEAHANVAEEDKVLRKELIGVGFRRIRLFLELTLDMSEVGWREVERAGAGCRLLHHGETEALAELQNASFAGSWGYCPETPDAIRHRLGIADHYPTILAVADGQGRIIAYSWVEITDKGTRGQRRAKGRINMLAVAPSHRGRGMGDRVLAAALLHLRDEGMEVVDLTVDARNEAARALYHARGFKIKKRSPWYGRALNSDVPPAERQASRGTPP